MTTESPETYFRRCYDALGQSAQDGELVARWCFDNPPRRELPKVGGARDGSVFVPRKLLQVLRLACPDHTGQLDAMVSAIVHLWVNDNMPVEAAMLERHAQEIEARIVALRQQEPQLQTQEESPELRVKRTVAAGKFAQGEEE